MFRTALMREAVIWTNAADLTRKGENEDFCRLERLPGAQRRRAEPTGAQFTFFRRNSRAGLAVGFHRQAAAYDETVVGISDRNRLKGCKEQENRADQREQRAILPQGAEKR